MTVVSAVVLSVSSTIVFSDISKEEVSAWCVAYDFGSNTYYTCKDESTAICEAMANGALMSCPGLLLLQHQLISGILFPAGISMAMSVMPVRSHLKRRDIL